MEWFSGPIPEAINLAKVQNKLFVVFISDNTSASTSTAESLDECKALLEPHIVGIRLCSDGPTERIHQFSEIYPVNGVPCLYFINPLTGSPVVVLVGAVTVDELNEKLPELTAVLQNVDQPSNSGTSQSNDPSRLSDPQENTTNTTPVFDQSVESDPATGTSPSTSDAAVPTPSLVIQSESSAGQQTEVQQPENEEASSSDAKDDQQTDDTSNSQMTLEERIARAKMLAQQKQLEKEQEKKESELNSEIQRRQVGKEMRRIKKEQEEKEMRDAAAERRKAKEDDRLARERVRAQIAADRAEREIRAAMMRGDVAAPSPSPAPASSSSPASTPADGMCRLKLRLPDGSSSIAKFSVTATLADVNTYVADIVRPPFPQFRLASSTLQRPFTEEDMSRSLEEMQLTPSAIIVIMPRNTRAGGNSGAVSSTGGAGLGNMITSLIWMIIAPVTTLFGYIRTFLFASPPRPGSGFSSSGDSDSSHPQGGSGSSSSFQRRTDRPRSGYGTRDEARYRMDGNVRRLINDDDDDDDNNTWNGNSTQQM